MSIVEQLKANVDKLNAVNFEGVAEKIKELKKELAVSKSSTSSQVEKLNSEIVKYEAQLNQLNNSLEKSTGKLLELQTSINNAINSDGRRKSRRKRSKKRKSRKRKL